MRIAIAHEKGGSGKTLTALNLIPSLAPDLVIDLDPLKCLTKLNGLREDNNKFNVLHCENKAALIDMLKANSKSNLLVDCGGFDSQATRTAIKMADIIITPCNGDPSELIGLVSFNKILKEIGGNDNPLTGYVLINRVSPAKRNHQALINFVNKASNLVLLNTVIPRRQPVVDASAHGLAITEINNKDKSVVNAQQEFKLLAQELKDLL